MFKHFIKAKRYNLIQFFCSFLENPLTTKNIETKFQKNLLSLLDKNFEKKFNVSSGKSGHLIGHWNCFGKSGSGSKVGLVRGFKDG